MSEFVLALDAGMTGVTMAITRAVAHEESQGATSAAGRDRADIPVFAFITDDGDVVFGAEAAERGRDHPERVIPQFTRSIGDPVPFVVGGFAVSADELFARLVAWLIETVSHERGARPSAVALAHPTSWCGHRATVVRERLREFGVDDVTMMPSAVIVARQLASQSSRGRTIGVYDLGGSSFEATLLRGERVLGEPQTIDVGGEDVDAALLAHVLSLLERDPGDRSDRAELMAARAAVVRAKEGLSFSADVSVPIAVGGRASTVRVTRSELDAMASAPIARTVGALEQAMESAGVDVADVDEIILVGGSARIPLVAQILSAQFDRPLTVPVDPQFAVAESIARIVSVRLQRRSAALELSARQDEPQSAAARRDGPPTARTSTGWPQQSSHGAVSAVRSAQLRIPYGAAAAMVAAGVIIATGMVFATTTPLGGSDAANGSSPEEPRRGEPRSLVRTVSDYSADGVTRGEDAPPSEPDAGETDPSDVVDLEDAPVIRAEPRRGGPSIDALGPEPTESSPTRSTPAADPTPTGGATPVPSPPTTQSPPTEDGPQPESTSHPVADPDPTPLSDPTPMSEPTPASDPADDSAPAPDPAPASETVPAADPVPMSVSDPSVTSSEPAPATTEPSSPTDLPREATAA